MNLSVKLNNIKNNIFDIINFQNIFFLGVFLIPSAVLPGLVCILTSLIYSLISKKKSSLSNPSNLILIFSAGLMIFNAATIYLKNINNDVPNWSSMDSFIGLFNWIPFFVLFWGLQPYLKNIENRRIFSVCIVSGTIPIIFTAIGQYFFNWNGPFDFYGLITWFQRPLNLNEGVTGLFHNPNYAGTWLSIVWPFSLEIFLRNYKNNSKKIISGFISLSILITALLSFSRNTLIGILITLLVSLSFKFFPIILFSFIFLEILILISFILIKLGFVTIIADISTSNFENIINFNYQYAFPRIEIWFKSISLISKRVWGGWGATSFPDIYKSSYPGLDIQHTHNIVLELAYNFGIPLAIILSLFVLYIIFKSYTILSKRVNNQLINKFWMISILVIFVSHLFDITNYDGRFNTISWILLAGVKCIIDENNLKENKNIYK